jgi:anti-sigma-K factor RskA
MKPNEVPSIADSSDRHAHVQSLLAPYALSALELDERTLVDAHIGTCASCMDELGELLETSAVIGLSSIEAPPASVWNNISKAMRADEVQPVSAAPQAVATDLNEFREKKQTRMRSWRTAVVAAAAAVAVTVPITLSLVDPATPTLAAMAAKASKSEGSRVVAMVGTDKSTVGDVILEANGHGYARLNQLKPLPDGETYQLWSVVDGQAISVGVLGREPVTSVFMTDPHVQAVALTVEKTGGVISSKNQPIGAATFV